MRGLTGLAVAPSIGLSYRELGKMVVARRFPTLAVAMLFFAALAALPVRGRAVAEAQAASPNMDGPVAFATLRDGDFEIYVMASDGSAQRNVSQAPSTADLDPA
jgi:hypothetical protein